MLKTIGKKLATGIYNNAGLIAKGGLIGLGAYGANAFINRYKNPVEPYVNEAIVDRRRITETRSK